jgi:hypothetical protein
MFFLIDSIIGVKLSEYNSSAVNRIDGRKIAFLA